jgi:hypothetical protein
MTSRIVTVPGTVTSKSWQFLRTFLFAALLALALGLIAWLSPEPTHLTDRPVYEATAAQFIVRDCSDLHCFRVLVAWTLGSLPGPSLVKWKTYAVVMNAAAAMAVFGLCLVWGLSRQAARLAAALSAFGFGTLYTLHDSFTSDPLMYLVGPLAMILLARERVAAAGILGAVAVTAKEFAVAPTYMFAGSAWIEGRRELAARAFVAANMGLIVWLTLQLVLIVGFNYSYGDSPSTHLLSGGYLLTWTNELGLRGAATALVNEFGAIWVLAPAGLVLASSALRRLTVVALPVAAIFAYVQQPDRALWNFHFLAAPLSALVLERARPAVAVATIATFALANLRVGAQLRWMPAARFTMLVSAVLAVVAIAAALRGRARPASVEPRLASA